MDPGGIFLLSLFGCSYHGLWPAGCSPTNTVTGAVVLNPIGNRFVPFLSHICSFSLNFCLSNLILKGKLDKQRLLVDIVDIFDCHDVDLNSGHTRVGRRCSSEKSSSMRANFSVVQQCSADLCDSRSAFVASKRTSTVCPCEEYKKKCCTLLVWSLCRRFCFNLHQASRALIMQDCSFRGFCVCTTVNKQRQKKKNM